MVDPVVKNSQTALDVVQHLLPLVVIQVTHALPQTNSQLAPLTADFLYDIQLGEYFDCRLALCAGGKTRQLNCFRCMDKATNLRHTAKKL